MRSYQDSPGRFDRDSARPWNLRLVAGLGHCAPAMPRSGKKTVKQKGPAPLSGYEDLLADVARVIAGD
jgi:hypothetical protein